jgi:protein-disulfide isomerase
MIRNVIIVLALLASAYLAYDIFRLYTASREAHMTPREYAIAPGITDLDVVEFLDYSCKYCKEIHPTITQAVEKDGRVRYIPRPLASENEDSRRAAQFVYAAGKQGKFPEMHKALIENYRVLNDDVMAELAAQTGIDLEKAKHDMESKSIENLILRNANAFKNLGGDATPTFLIGTKLKYVPADRMPEVSDFLSMFQEARGMKP